MVQDTSSCMLLCTAWNVSATQNGSFGLCPIYGECVCGICWVYLV